MKEYHFISVTKIQPTKCFNEKLKLKGRKVGPFRILLVFLRGRWEDKVNPKLSIVVLKRKV